VAQSNSPARRDGQDIGEQFRQCGFVVGYFAGKQTVSFVVDEHAVVISFSGIDAGPEFRHVSLHRVVLLWAQADGRAVVSLHCDRVAFLN
jgi:hypothetical protein